MRILQNNRLRFRLQNTRDKTTVYVRGLLLTDDGVQYPIAVDNNEQVEGQLKTVSEIELPAGELLWISAAFRNDKSTTFQGDRTFVSIELLSRAAVPEAGGTPLIQGWLFDGQTLAWPSKTRESLDRPRSYFHVAEQLNWQVGTTPYFYTADAVFEEVKTIQFFMSNSSLQSSTGYIIIRQNLGDGFTLYLGMISFNVQASVDEAITIQCGIESGTAVPEPGQQFEYLPALGLSPGDTLRFASQQEVSENLTLKNIIVSGIGTRTVRYPSQQ